MTQDGQGNPHLIDIFIGKKLKERRKKLNLTQKTLSEAVGVSHQQVQQYETGKNRISASKLFEIAHSIDVPYSYFFEDFKPEGGRFNTMGENGHINAERFKPLKILLIENDTGDALLMQEVMKESHVPYDMWTERNGLNALQSLRDKPMGHPERPDIIIMDLNLPKEDGHSILAMLKKDPDLKSIPVIVMSNSINVDDMLRAYDAQAAGYVKKTLDIDRFSHSLLSLVDYWSMVVLPSLQYE